MTEPNVVGLAGEQALSLGVNLLSSVIYDFLKGIPARKLKYFPNAMLFSKESLIELEKRIKKFAENKRWQHSSHPVLYAYFDVDDPGSVDRFRPLICAAMFGEPYSVDSCRQSLLSVLESTVETLKDKFRKAKRKLRSDDLKNYSIDNIDVDEFNKHNLTDLRKEIFRNDEISKLLIERLRSVPIALAEQPISSNDLPAFNEATRSLLISYCDEMFSQVSSLTTSGIDAFLRQEQIQNQLEASFVALSLRNFWTDDTQAENAELIFQKFDYVIARGDAGSGKTTLLQWISLQCVRSIRAALLGEELYPQNEWDFVVPIFVPLRRVVTGFSGKLAISDFIYLSTGSIDFSRKAPSTWTDWLLENCKTIVMFDGLDELPFQSRFFFWTFVRRFKAKYPKAKIVITSRNLSYTHTADGRYKNILSMSAREFSAHRHEWNVPEGFLDFQIAPLGEDEIQTFIRRWHDGLSRDVIHPETAIQLESYPRELIVTLEEPIHADVKALCQIPLLCTLVCIVNLFSHGRLPESLRKLYFQAVRILGQTRDEIRNVPSAVEFSPLRSPARTDILGHIALTMQEGVSVKGGTASLEARKEDVLVWIDNYKKRRGDDPLNQLENEDILRFYTERTNILREPTLGNIDFIHRSFLEYLAANEYVNRREVFALRNHLFDDFWTGVLRFMMDTEEGGSFFAGAIVDNFLDVARSQSASCEKVLIRLSEIMTHSNRLPDKKYEELNNLLKKVWPPKSAQHALGLRYLPCEAFGNLASYSTVKSFEPDQRANVAELICCHSDERMKAQLTTGFFQDDSVGVAMTLNAHRAVNLAEHQGLWYAAATQINRTGRLELVCDDAKVLCEKWNTVGLFTNPIKSRVIVHVNRFTRHLAELKNAEFIWKVVVEAEDDKLAKEVGPLVAAFANVEKRLVHTKLDRTAKPPLFAGRI